VRISEILVFAHQEGNLDCPIIFLAVKENSPIFPVERSIDVDFIEVVLVRDPILDQSEEISLAYFAVAMHFPDCTLKLGICTATPIGVVLLSSTNPLSLLINEISDWVQYYITQPRDIFLAVGGIVELNRKFVSIQLRVILLPR